MVTSRSICARLDRVALAYGNKELSGHGRDYHKDGFGSPIGAWKQVEIAEGKDASALSSRAE